MNLASRNDDIRKAIHSDQEAIWAIIKAVIATGDTYCFAPNSSKETMLRYWFGEDKHTYVATVDGNVAGTFVVKDNQVDLGSHIANASYMVSADYEGQGIGKFDGGILHPGSQEIRLQSDAIQHRCKK